MSNVFDTLRGGAWVIVLSQIWECCAYYGLRAILVLFLTLEIGYADNRAFGVYLSMIALADVLSIIGGRFGDGKTGSAKSSILGGFSLLCGFSLIKYQFSDLTFYAGAACLSVGVAFYRPNCFNLMGEIMRSTARAGIDEHGMKRRVDSGIALAYGLIDIGFIMAYLLVGFLSERMGWDYAFGMVLFSMAISFAYIFWAECRLIGGFLKALIWIFDFRSLVLFASMAGLIAISAMLIYMHDIAVVLIMVGVLAAFIYIGYLYTRMSEQHRKRTVAFCAYLFLFAVFIAIERQINTVFPLFLERNTERDIWGIVVPVAAIYVIMPLVALIFGPINAYVLSKWRTESFIPGFRSIIAFLCFALCYSLMYLVCGANLSDGIVPIVYPIISITLFTMADSVFVPSIFSLSMRLAPEGMRGLFNGAIFSWVALGTMLGKPLAAMMALSNNKNVDPVSSIEVYRSGFGKLALLSAAFALVAVCVKIALDRFMSVRIIREQTEVGDLIRSD